MSDTLPAPLNVTVGQDDAEIRLNFDYPGLDVDPLGQAQWTYDGPQLHGFSVERAGGHHNHPFIEVQFAYLVFPPSEKRAETPDPDDQGNLTNFAPTTVFDRPPGIGSYQYRIRAVGQLGYGPYSNTVSVVFA